MKKPGVAPYKKLNNDKSSIEIKAPIISKTVLFSYLNNKEYDQFLQCINQVFSSKLDEEINPLLLQKESVQKTVNQLVLIEKGKNNKKKTGTGTNTTNDDPTGSNEVNIVSPLRSKELETQNIYSSKVYINSRRNVEQDEEIKCLEKKLEEIKNRNDFMEDKKKSFQEMYFHEKNKNFLGESKIKDLIKEISKLNMEKKNTVRLEKKLQTLEETNSDMSAEVTLQKDEVKKQTEKAKKVENDYKKQLRISENFDKNTITPIPKDSEGKLMPNPPAYENLRHKKEVDKFKLEIYELQDDLASKTERLNNSQQDVKDLKSSINKDKRSFEKDIKNLTFEVNYKQKEIEGLKTEIYNLNYKNNEFANQINNYDENKTCEFYELQKKIKKQLEEIAKKDAIVVDLREINLSTEQTAVNRKEMCYKNEADIVVLESKVRDWKTEYENLLNKLNTNNDSFLELLKEKDSLEFSLKYAEEFNIKNEKKVQMLEGNLKFYKDHYDEIQENNNMLLKKNNSLKKFQESLEQQITTLQENKFGLLTFKENIEKDKKSLEIENKAKQYELEILKKEMNQIEDEFVMSCNKSIFTYKEQVEGQKSINDKQINLFEGEKGKNNNLHDENIKLNHKIDKLEETIETSGQLMRQISGQLKVYEAQKEAEINNLNEKLQKFESDLEDQKGSYEKDTLQQQFEIKTLQDKLVENQNKQLAIKIKEKNLSSVEREKQNSMKDILNSIDLENTLKKSSSVHEKSPKNDKDTTILLTSNYNKNCFNESNYENLLEMDHTNLLFSKNFNLSSETEQWSPRSQKNKSQEANRFNTVHKNDKIKISSLGNRRDFEINEILVTPLLLNQRSINLSNYATEKNEDMLTISYQRILDELNEKLLKERNSRMQIECMLANEKKRSSLYQKKLSESGKIIQELTSTIEDLDDKLLYKDQKIMAKDVSKKRVFEKLQNNYSLLEEEAHQNTYLKDLNQRRLNLYQESSDKVQSLQEELEIYKSKNGDLELRVEQMSVTIKDTEKYKTYYVKFCEQEKSLKQINERLLKKDKTAQKLQQEVILEKKTREFLEKRVEEEKKKYIDYKKSILERVGDSKESLYKSYIAFSMIVIAYLLGNKISFVNKK